MDFGLALLGLLLTWPLFLLIPLAIRFESPGPVLFRQTRLGLNGKPFQILKFRTMTASAPEEEKPQWATSSDPRITKVGRFLRKAHLDELPQLINILKRKMSLIGPRAEWDAFARQSQELVPEWRPGRRPTDPPDFKVLVKYREQIPYYSYRLLVKPGVTGWAQVMFPYAGSSLEEMKEKLQYDLYYIKNMGLLLDLAIAMKTIRIVLFGYGK
jgi:lipopolysaccharide/colanic/teichoic acid biosynthesis glycosyltransferase